MINGFSRVQPFMTPCSPLGSSVPGILQARILEWVAMPSSRGSSRLRDGTRVSYVSCGQAGSLPLVPPVSGIGSNQIQRDIELKGGYQRLGRRGGMGSDCVMYVEFQFGNTKSSVDR